MRTAKRPYLCNPYERQAYLSYLSGGLLPSENSLDGKVINEINLQHEKVVVKNYYMERV